MVTIEQLNTFFVELSKVYDEQSAYLTELDSPIGDADHGINMKRGFQAVVSHLSENTHDSISALLKNVSMQLIKTVGGLQVPSTAHFSLKHHFQPLIKPN